MSRKKQIDDKKFVEAVDLSGKLTCKQIADKLNVKSKTLWHRMNRAGVKAVDGRLARTPVNVAIERGELPDYRVFPLIPPASLTVSQIERLKTTSAKADLNLICSCVCEYLCIDKKQMELHSRTGERVWARQVFFYLAYKLSGQPWTTIGDFMRKRDHTTSIYNGNACKDAIETDPERARQVREIEGIIKNRLK